MMERPTPDMVGTGAANKAANLLELRRKQKEAALKGDFDLSDRIEQEIRELQQKLQKKEGGGATTEERVQQIRKRRAERYG
jgi:hypothetical protein